MSKYYPIVCYFITFYLSVNAYWVVSISWLLWIMLLLSTFVCMYAFISSGFIYPGVELLDQMVTLSWNFKKTARLFARVPPPFYVPSSNVWTFQFLHTLTNNPRVIIWYLIVTVLVDVRCYVLAVLVCIFPDDRWYWASFHVLLGHL